jgi:uncharacterized membrane protein
MIAIHSIGMIFSLIICSFMLLTLKGTTRHRWLGRIYVTAMIVACTTSFFIGEEFNFLHVLSAFTLYWLAIAVWAVRKKAPRWQERHASNMGASYIGIIIAGVGVMVRHFIDPGNTNLGYMWSGVTAVIAVPIMNFLLRKRFKTVGQA